VNTNKQTASVAAVILAAGQSRRMGQPKQLLRVAGKPLLEHTIANVRASGVQQIVLVLGARADEIRKSVSLDGVTVVENPEHEQGMGTSIGVGLKALSPGVSGALIVLADQPFVQTGTLDKLMEQHRQSKAQIVIPMFKGFRGNPVLLDRSVFPEVMGLPGDVGCRAIFGDHTQGIYKVAVDDVGVLLDADTPADVEQIETYMAGRAAILPDMELREGATQSGGPELVLVGAGAMPASLAKLAHLLKFRVTLVDPLLRLDQFPEADCIVHMLDFSLIDSPEQYVVVASRGRCDEEAIQQALESKAKYVAMVANRKRSKEVLRSLAAQGVQGIDSVRAPAGIEIGAETPEEIALSVMSEIVAAKRGAMAAKEREYR
jgi:molybdenum cofactor cytidylyltransferase